MAREFNITAADKFFLGEDKVIEFTILGLDDVTPLELGGVPLEWSMRKTDKASDPAILASTPIGSIELTLVGVYSPNPTINTERVRLTFVPADTRTGIKPGVPYRHSLKRTDIGNNNILSYGSITFLQATEH